MTAARIGSLFAGIGGLDLAIAGRTVWFSEVHPVAAAMFAARFPDAIGVGDMTTVDFAALPPVDVICGGFPCQDLSTQGKGEGLGGKKSGLWFEMLRAIREAKPRWVVVENVATLPRRGLDVVLAGLAEAGFDAAWGVFTSADIGAPHLRARTFIVAHATGLKNGDSDDLAVGVPVGPQSASRDETRIARFEAFAPSIRLWEEWSGMPHPEPFDPKMRLRAEFVEWMMGFPPGWTAGWTRGERLARLGNAVQPQTAAHAIKILAERLRTCRESG